MKATVLGAWAALVVTAVLAAPAAAQDDPAPPSEADVARRVAEADAALARGEAAAALALYREVASALWDFEDYRAAAAFGCGMGAAELTAGPLDTSVLRSARAALGGGLAVARDARARRACMELGARAFAAIDVGALEPELAAEVTRFARAWTGRASSRSTASAAVPPGIEAADPEALARAIEDRRYLDDPTRLPGCTVDWDTTAPGAGVIDCYESVLPEQGFGSEYPHQAFYFVAAGRRVRVIGTTTRMSGFDCETGVVRETVRFERLRMARHGVDGTLRITREGGDDGAGWVSLTTVADLCDATAGSCRSVPLGRTRCEPDANDQPQCSERWEASARVAAGALVVRRVRGALPASLAPSTPVASIFAEAPAEALGPGQRTGACHAEVSDPRPPLNVRAAPDQGAPVAGVLPNGTAVRPRERRYGWIRIETPVAGWIWSRNLRRVCE